jgi:hypothetical protein
MAPIGRANRAAGAISAASATAVANGRNARTHSMLWVGTVLPPSRSHMPRDTALALSLSDTSCGPDR